VVIGAEHLNVESWARLALERLRHDNLGPTPNNYAIYYYYYSDQNPNLKMAMDTLIGQGGALTQAQCDDLHRRHLGLEAEHRILKQANEAIEAEVNRVLGVIDTAAKGTTDYSKSLDSFSGKLEDSASMEQIREAVTKVVSETRVMVQQNERLSGQLAAATEQLTEMRYNLDLVHKESQVDPLTEVGNRKFFDREIEHAVAESNETAAPLTLLMVDIDHFKKFNDSYGHQVGDQVLRLVARTLVESLKGRDVIARYGGEEFVILLPQTSVGDSEKVANQLRAALGTKQLKRRSTNESLGVITVSIGAAEYAKGELIDHFIERADQALYKAKQTGRNRVVSSVLSAEELAALAAEHKKSGA
jgi:diguanylate cyclase